MFSPAICFKILTPVFYLLRKRLLYYLCHNCFSNIEYKKVETNSNYFRKAPTLLLRILYYFNTL